MPTSDLTASPPLITEHRRTVSRALQLLRDADDPWNMQDLAEEIGLSPFYFSRIFRDITGIPPNEFQTAIRFERAKHLLLTSDAPVTDICFDVGYGSLGTFSSRFRRLVGVSPAGFRMLPEQVDRIDFSTEVINRHPRASHGTAAIHGTTILPPDFQGNVYIGLFPSTIAASHPIAGLMLPRSGPFELPGIPVGSWVLLACALRATTNPMDHLLPTGGVLVAAGGIVHVRRPDDRLARELRFREPDPFEPPVLTALTGLLL